MFFQILIVKQPQINFSSINSVATRPWTKLTVKRPCSNRN